MQLDAAAARADLRDKRRKDAGLARKFTSTLVTPNLALPRRKPDEQSNGELCVCVGIVVAERELMARMMKLDNFIAQSPAREGESVAVIALDRFLSLQAVH